LATPIHPPDRQQATGRIDLVPHWSVPDFIDNGLGCQVGEFSES
jgi:hypothetical protein